MILKCPCFLKIRWWKVSVCLRWDVWLKLHRWNDFTPSIFITTQPASVVNIFPSAATTSSVLATICGAHGGIRSVATSPGTRYSRNTGQCKQILIWYIYAWSTVCDFSSHLHSIRRKIFAFILLYLLPSFPNITTFFPIVSLCVWSRFPLLWWPNSAS